MRTKKPNKDIVKTKGLFDHINHIREVKDPNYFQTLSDADRKSFNKYLIIRILSMDYNLIEEMAVLSKYFDVIPNEQFYKILIDLVPKGRKFCKYIKNTSESINKTILKCICDNYKISERDASDYYYILMCTDAGIVELSTLIGNYGYSDKEIESMFKPI